jgi:hypothetical protein
VPEMFPNCSADRRFKESHHAKTDARYLTLAKFMLEVRGPQSKEEGAGNPYVQAQMKPADQTEAVAGGHAVRAVYMYSGMADVGALTGDMAYVNAIDKIWENVASKKLHITGGIGARAAGESFGADYELPNMSAYNETCAAVGNDFWNHRLFLLHADAKYIDVMERTLYNGLISGVSLDGKTFFYQNPLEAAGFAGKDQRSPWFGVACCPGNITRFMASVPGYVYAERGDAIWVNLLAIQRGPIVYAAEWADNPDGKVRNLLLPDSARFTAEYRASLLNGVEVVTGRAVSLAYDAQGQVTAHDEPLTMIPYYAWANRGRGQMSVWLPDTESAAHPQVYPAVVTTAKVTVSGRPQQRNVEVIKDGETPASSDDPSSYFDWYPARGNKETVDYTFAQPSTVSQCGLYWFDDTGHGGVRVPASWRLFYKDGGQWKPVSTQDSFGAAKDQFNVVNFTPVTTTALRVELQAQPNVSVGMQKWTVK